MTILEKITVDPRLDITLAQQIKDQFAWQIASGHLKPGDLLPSVRVLAQHLNININTVRSAYARLEHDGLVATRQGVGTQVLPFDGGKRPSQAVSLRSHTIGVILPDLASPFYHEFLHGVESVARRDRTMIFMCHSHDDPMEVRRYFAQLSAKGVDGILVISAGVEHLLPYSSRSRKPPAIPLVCVDWPTSRGYSVLMDLEGAGYLATRHLLEHGHRRIGLITLAFDYDNVNPINAGFYRALAGAGVEADPGLVARVEGFDILSGERGMQTLLQAEKPPSAVFAIADPIAIGAMRFARTAGLRIPQEISFAGFTDIALAAQVEPGLTTVAAPAYRMGSDAAKMLRKLIEGKRPRRKRLILAVELVVRQSCGCQSKLAP